MGAGRPGREVSVEEALAAIPDVSRVYVASGCGVPRFLMAAMADLREQWRRLEVVTGYLFEPLPLFEHAGRPFSFTSLHPTPALRSISDPAHLEVMALRYGDYPAQLGGGGLRPVDAVLVQVSPPDRRGRCSLGVSVGSVIDAVLNAPLIIAQVNERMPYTYGDGELDVHDLDLLVTAPAPLVEAPPTQASPTTTAIAEHVAGEVPDGATLQIGVGQVPSAVLDALSSHTDLGLHSGLLTASCRRLVELGVLTNRRKRTYQHQCVSAEVVGDANLFAWVDRNPAVRMVGAATSHGRRALLEVGGLVAVNSALEVDLTGALNVEAVDDEVVSGPGGLPDFAAAALAATDGRSVVALPSTSADGTKSRIVADLSGRPVALPAYLADRVVTEHGVARLRGRTRGERHEAMVAVADPRHRDRLRGG
jgi:acyl-CoA hydrolase